MIIALRSDKSQINLFEYTITDEIVKMKKNGPFYCPVCQNAVRLKTGNKRRAHFAHIQLNDCVNERKESKQHLDGKFDLYHFFNQYSVEVLIEQFIPEINQRPDLMIQAENEKISIEYQCSKIPLQAIQQRTESFKLIGMKVFWILGENLLSQKGRFSFSLNSLSFYSLITPEYPTLYFYDSSTKSFKILSSIIAFSSNMVVGKITDIKIEHYNLQKFSNHSTIRKKDFMTTWTKLKMTYRKSQHLNYKGNFYHLKEILYNLQIDYLPSIIGVPLNSNYVLSEHCIVWQGMLYFLFIHPVELQETIDLNELQFYLNNKIMSGEWKVNELQFKEKINMENCVENYIDFLEHFRIVKREKNGKIMKIANAIIPTSFQQALDEDCLTASKAFDLLFNNTTGSNGH